MPGVLDSITVGPDGNLWFTTASSIGAVLLSHDLDPARTRTSARVWAEVSGRRPRGQALSRSSQVGAFDGWADETAVLRPLFVVTGASCSGKTAVLPALARRLAGRCVTFDVDWLLDSASALGGQSIDWPAFRDAWLAVAHGVAQSGMPTVLLGPFIPEHLEGLPARRWIGDIRFIVLDCPDELRRDRINARPPWRSRDIEEQVGFGQWLRRNIPDRVDTSTGTPDDTAAAVASWIDGHLNGAATSTGRPPQRGGHLNGAATSTGRST